MKTAFFSIIFMFFNLFGYYSESTEKEFLYYIKNKKYYDLEELLKKKSAPDFLFDDLNFSPLQYAVNYEDIKLVKLLIKYRANINYNGYKKDSLPSPIFMSIKKGNIKIFKTLASSKSFNKNADEEGFTLLLETLHYKKTELAKFLISINADVNKCGNEEAGCPLHAASALGLNEIIKKIIDKKGNIEKEFKGFTPLMYAVMNGHVQSAKILLKNGADKFATYNKGNNDIRDLAEKQKNVDMKKFIESIFKYNTCPKIVSFFDIKNKSRIEYRPIMLRNKKIGLINKKGKVTRSLKANRISFPSEGVSWFEKFDKNRKAGYGFIDVSGKIIDKQGKLQSKFIFDNPVAITKDYKIGQVGNLWKFLDKTNKFIEVAIPDEFELVTTKEYPSINNGNYLVRKNDNHKLMNIASEVIFESEKKCSLIFENGSGRFRSGGEYGLFSEEGNVTTSNLFDDISENPSNGFFIVYKRFYSMNSKRAFLDPCGEILANEWFDDVKEFSTSGIGIYRNGDYWGIINYKGGKIGKPEYEEIDYKNTPFENSIIAVKKNGRWGFINEKGEETIPFLYNDATSFKEGRATVLEGNQWWVIDEKGKKIFKVSSKGYFLNGLLYDEGSVYDLNGKSLPYIPYYEKNYFGGF